MYIFFVGTFLLVTAIAFIISLIVTPLAIRLAPKIGAVDIPKDNRRMHTKAMPRFGGLAIFISTMCAMVLAQYVFLPYLADTWTIYWEVGGLIEPVDKITGILIGGCLIYIVGVVDDLRGMPAKVKFLCQILCAAVVYGFGVRIEFLTNHFGDFFGNGHTYLNTIIGCVATIIWIVGITNTINLIDGLDGLAAGVAAIASFAIGYTAYIHGMYTATIVVLAVAGGALGFLPYNFHPAKIFMGDSGSLFLGFMLASVSIIGPVKSATVLATAVPVLVLGVPIFDTAFAILRRIVNKRPIMEADKGHLHHRLMAAGLGQTRSVLMLYGISGVMGVAAILFSRDYFLECFALFALAANFIYIFLVDAQTPFLQIRGARKASKDAEGVPAEAVTGGQGEGEADAEYGRASEQEEPEENQPGEPQEIQHDNEDNAGRPMPEEEPADVSEEETDTEETDEAVETPLVEEEMQEDAGEKI